MGTKKWEVKIWEGYGLIQTYSTGLDEVEQNAPNSHAPNNSAMYMCGTKTSGMPTTGKHPKEQHGK
jgi:hypothetical protein